MASPANPTRHLWVAVTDPDPQTGEVVIANITTQAPGRDQTCILNPGDHPFLKHESVMNYAEAMIPTEESVERAARGRVVQWDVPLAPAVLSRVQLGCIASNQTEPAVKEAVKKALGIT